MIEGYNQRGELVYRFRYIVQLANYLGLDYNSVKLDLDNSRQFNFADYMFHISDKQEELSSEQFEALICQYGEDNSINPVDIAYGTDCRGNISCMMIEGKIYIFKHIIPMMFAGTHTIIEALNSKFTANPDPEFVEDFGYPQPKRIDGIHAEYTPDKGNGLFEAPEGTIIVTPNDDIYGTVQKWVDQRDAEEAEERKLAMACNAGEFPHSFTVTKTMSQKEIDRYFKKIVECMDDKYLEEAKNAKEVKACANHMNASDGGNYSANGSSSHYKAALVEYIDDVELQHGTVIAFITCHLQAVKYRARAGKKEGVPAEKDIVKAKWYETCSLYLREKIDVFQKGSDDDVRDFLDKYGHGRTYINMSPHIYDLLQSDIAAIIGLSNDLLVDEAKMGNKMPLGDIVNMIQNNG